VISIWVIGRYFKDEKQLRRFPSPSIAAFTPLWSMWQSWKGTQTIEICKVHEKLGPVVRIAPNHVSFTDPRAYKDIYGHGAPLVKDDFYAHIAEGNPSVAQATEKAVHSAKRRALAHVFSAKEITAMEPRVVATTQNLCAAIRNKISGRSVGEHDQTYSVVGSDNCVIFDIRPWVNMFTYDAISNMVFTNEYGFLKKGSDLCLSTDGAGQKKEVHAMDSFHSASRYNTITAQLPRPLYQLCRRFLFWVHGNKAGGYFGGMSRFQVQHRLRNQPAQPDLFSSFPAWPTEKRPDPMEEDELVAECATMLDAGNDTTQTTLVNCIFHLASNPEKQEKLYNALTSALSIDKKERADEIDFYVPKAKQIQDIPYLRAVLEENWRCRPPVARGLPRRTTGQGTTIAGHFIPPGVTVSAPIYALHRNETLFRQPLDFIPERWIPDEGFGKDEQEAKNLKEYCIPFSLGPRACIGRNLAYMEVSIVVAALVLNFEWELAEKCLDMPMIERFNNNPKELLVKGKVRG
jgi:benzoate 4-monooxygenase